MMNFINAKIRKFLKINDSKWLQTTVNDLQPNNFRTILQFCPVEIIQS
ncbi:hypothetical protein FEDK69T_07340 [Flavobacterium enshiense DK69]|nr:hypothetical protein FEDK69T_07340 [Flavobacterium enshiense DK69]